VLECGGPYFEADWRREQLRTNLWLVSGAADVWDSSWCSGITPTGDRHGLITDGSIPRRGCLPAAPNLARVVFGHGSRGDHHRWFGTSFLLLPIVAPLTLVLTQFGPADCCRNFVRRSGRTSSFSFLGKFVARILLRDGRVGFGGRRAPHGDFLFHIIDHGDGSSWTLADQSAVLISSQITIASDDPAPSGSLARNGGKPWTRDHGPLDQKKHGATSDRRLPREPTHGNVVCPL